MEFRRVLFRSVEQGADPHRRHPIKHEKTAPFARRRLRASAWSNRTVPERGPPAHPFWEKKENRARRPRFGTNSGPPSFRAVHRCTPIKRNKKIGRAHV